MKVYFSLKIVLKTQVYQQIIQVINKYLKKKEKSLGWYVIPTKFVFINKMFNQQLITNIMNKSELIDAIAADAGITKAAAKSALESFLFSKGW